MCIPLTNKNIINQIYKNNLKIMSDCYIYTFLRPLRYYINENNNIVISFFILIKIFKWGDINLSVNYTIYNKPFNSTNFYTGNFYNFLEQNISFNKNNKDIFKDISFKTITGMSCLSQAVDFLNDDLSVDLDCDVKLATDDVLKYL